MTQIAERYYPIFLPNKPVGEDKFEGRAQQKTAENIINLIQQNYYSPKIIGVEGDWGAGKSNLIELIRTHIDKKYFTFIFDAWGNQEDLTRKSFLEQLVSQLIDENCLGNIVHVEKIKDELLSKKSKKRNEKTPIIRPFWLMMVASLLTFGFLDSLYSNIIKDSDIIPNVSFGIFKPILSLYIIPTLLFLWALFLIATEYKDYKKLNPNKSMWDILSYIIYWFQGKEVVTTENEVTLEDEPSVYKFRDYFRRIEQEVSKNNRMLIIVFDNLDRLEKEKIKSLWSSIHTFFSETKENLDSWVIIPYNKQELVNHLNDDASQETGIGFIEKSIPINFRITPPVVREWETFFNEKLSEAFGSIIIDSIEKNILLKIFDNHYSKIIKPRQIINYINNIVSLHLQWEKEILDGKIKISHLGVFALAKDEIVKDPVTEILSQNYLKAINADKLFEFDKDLETAITALTFGVPLEMADEVLIYRGIKDSILGEDEISLYSPHKAFKSYFYKAYYEIDIKEKVDSIPNLLVDLEDVLSPNENQEYWKNYTKGLLSLDDEFHSFRENHKKILLKNNDSFMKEGVIKKILNYCASEISIGMNGGEGVHYFQTLTEIEDFIHDKELNIDIINFLKPVSFPAYSFLNFVYDKKEDYKKYKINCEEENIVKLFENTKGDLEMEKVETSIESLKIIKSVEKYQFEKINNTAINRIGELDWDKSKELGLYLNVLKYLNTKPLKLKLSTSFYSQLDISKLSKNEVYFDALCIAISNFNDYYLYMPRVLSNLSEEEVQKVSEKIEWYFSYGDLLQLIVSNSEAENSESLKKIAINLTVNDYGASRLFLDWVLKNYSKIISKVFDSNKQKEENFILRINEWQAALITEPQVIDQRFYTHIVKQDLLLIKKISDKAAEYFNSLSKDKYLDMMKNTVSIDYTIFQSLVDNKLVSSFNDEFYSAYGDFLKGMANEEMRIPDNYEFWDNLIDLLNGRKLKSYFTSLRDYFSDHDDMSENEICFFETGLIKYGNLEKKKDDISLKFILPMIKSDNCFESIFLHKWKELKNIILNSQHNETIIGELRTIYNSETYKDNEVMILISKEFGL